LGKKRKLEAMRQKLKYEYKADVILLQETHCSAQNIVEEWSKYMLMEGYGSSTSSRRVGVAILVKHDYFKDIKTTVDKEGRIIYMEASRNNEKWLIACIYAPNEKKERTEFFKNINFLGPDYKKYDIIILGGDFNVTLYDKDKLNSSNGNRDPSKPPLYTLLLLAELSDTYHRSFPEKPCISWTNGKYASRIDYFFTNENLDDRIKTIQYESTGFTDHKACILHIDPPVPIIRGQGYWRLNNRLLQVYEWQEEFQNLLSKEEKAANPINENIDYGLRWENMKYEVMMTSRKHAAKLQYKNKKKRERLEYKLAIQERHWLTCKKSLQKKVGRRCEYLRQKLVKLNETHLENILDKYRIRKNNEEEKYTGKYYEYGKTKKANSNITALKDPNSSRICQNKEELIDITFHFYKDLYKKQEPNYEAMNQLLAINTNKLSAEAREMCDRPIIEEEVYQAILQQNLNTAPGIDGIPIEFYHAHARQLTPTLLRAFNNWTKNGELQLSQKTGIIILIYKKGDRNDLQNYRPISLTCCDIKIFTTILTNRLQQCIKEIIQADQTGFIQGRTIHTNIRTVEDLWIYAIKNHISGGLLFLDQFKAFDLTNREFMYACLDHFGAGSNMKNMIKMVYNGLKSQVIINGWLTPAFDIGRGVRQGDPLSPILFNIGIETLANAFRHSTIYKGIDLPGKDNIKVLMYADDTLIVFQKQSDVNEIDEILQLYSKASGAIINKSKSEIVLFQLEDINKFDVKDYTIKKHTKYLGIMIGHDIPTNLIWDPILSKMRAICILWKKRSLSIQDRVVLCKSLIYSRVWYIATNQLIPQTILEEIKQIAKDFIWAGKKAPVKHKIAALRKRDGGLGVLNVELQIQAIRSKWITQWFSDEPQKWKSIVTWFLEESTKKTNLGMNIFKTDRYYPGQGLTRFFFFCRSLFMSFFFIKFFRKKFNYFDTSLCPPPTFF
jgi:exonuclease III